MVQPPDEEMAVSPKQRVKAPFGPETSSRWAGRALWEVVISSLIRYKKLGFSRNRKVSG